MEEADRVVGRLLDLCCGAGGASMGYHLAGWEVVGVDNAPQPDYPFEFHQADALDYLAHHGSEFAAVHASPPCQASSTLTKGTNAVGSTHIDQIGVYRRHLRALDLPYIIENVVTAQLRPDLTLCGGMFGLQVLRHRRFELSFPVEQPPHPAHRGRVQGWRHGRNIKGSYFSVYGKGGYKGTLDEWRNALGTDWITTRKSLANAIPPAYTQFIGTSLLYSLQPPEVRISGT